MCNPCWPLAQEIWRFSRGNPNGCISNLWEVSLSCKKTKVVHKDGVFLLTSWEAPP